MPANQRMLSIPELRALLSAFKHQHGAEYSLRTLGYFGSYFYLTEDGEDKLDAICMILIAAGEELKNIDRKEEANER